jgi:hypothetical protein
MCWMPPILHGQLVLMLWLVLLWLSIAGSCVIMVQLCTGSDESSRNWELACMGPQLLGIAGQTVTRSLRGPD